MSANNSSLVFANLSYDIFAIIYDDTGIGSISSKIAMIIAYSLIPIIGVPGNIIIGMILSNKKYRKSNGDIFLMTLAIFDILASGFIPLVTIHDIIDMKWKLGYVACKMFPSFHILTLVGSAWSLVIISC